MRDLGSDFRLGKENTAIKHIPGTGDEICIRTKLDYELELEWSRA